jgi:hypothetical protein
MATWTVFSIRSGYRIRRAEPVSGQLGPALESGPWLAEIVTVAKCPLGANGLALARK